ncbi:thiamine-phosphate kinase [Undibacterium sp.]|jgi:thiamine-monophosphate kinase|uniref:thiamine-phosphate kinase n=1 Tax=Undibacterium sp. TaxID=1914977 RepID=UPI002CDCAE7A|nr:thiamine-phosphate kinase [Undibacterium sp.]HTD03411.1 thiamine-phosphate kinase [Undibacterium sp.]
MLSEFDLIKHYFARPAHTGASADPRIALGIGDDCALLNPTPGMQLAISSDMLVSGRHFFPDADPAMLGHKCLAVNLSDLAAMGAEPLAFTLALSLPEANPAWLAPFSAGLLALADKYQCALIGGDTTKGPLNICITIFGEIPPGQALRRDAAQVGDDIWVSGTLGDARLALAGYWKEHTELIRMDDSEHSLAALRMHQPSPRIELGMALRGIAHAALDISDGLAGDLGHVLERSGVGACLQLDSLPAGPVLSRQVQEIRRQYTLAGGDDYEICFTAPAAKRAEVIAAGASSGTPVTRIGSIEQAGGLRLVGADGQPLSMNIHSFDHFTSA